MAAHRCELLAAYNLELIFEIHSEKKTFMGYRSLRECVLDLERAGQLIRFREPIDARLEAAEVQRRVFAAGGPAILFENVIGCRFSMVSNLFGTVERARFLFRDTLSLVQQLVRIKADPANAFAAPWRSARALPTAWAMRPKLVSSGPILDGVCRLTELPQLVSWPNDGGPFITLPAVYTEHPDRRGWQKSNLGMYRVQLGGNEYVPDEQVGLHYQIHRSIGVHHAAALRRGEPLPVVITVGGPPVFPLAAVMPLPEGLSELTFAGALGGRRVRMISSRVVQRRWPARGDEPAPLPLLADADFCIVGKVHPGRVAPEGPFGDHLGYYSLQHDFPVVEVERVLHRRDAIWPFTVVGRPPQEDTSFGALIHEITGPMIPAVLPGVKAVHAVDAAGVHPLLLAIGSERYTPTAGVTQPQELLTQANAILGQGQLSLAKYLFIVAENDDPQLDIHNIDAFLTHLLRRVDWTRDLHFQTCTTIDTLDYSGEGLNSGSKVVVAAAGPVRRELLTEVASGLSLPEGFRDVRLAAPGVLAVSAPPCRSRHDGTLQRFCAALKDRPEWARYPLCMLVDDAEFTARSLANFLWVTFTRSNPASDIDGMDSFVRDKHWGCRGALVIDARIKPHHAPPLEEDSRVTEKVNNWARRGGPLAGVVE